MFPMAIVLIPSQIADRVAPQLLEGFPSPEQVASGCLPHHHQLPLYWIKGGVPAMLIKNHRLSEEMTRGAGLLLSVLSPESYPGR